MLFSRSADLNGRARHFISGSVINPFGVTLYEEYIYWTDTTTSQVERINRFTGHDRSVLLNNTLAPYSIHVNHKSKQPIGQYITRHLWCKSYYSRVKNLTLMTTFWLRCFDD